MAVYHLHLFGETKKRDYDKPCIQVNEAAALLTFSMKTINILIALY